MRMPPPGDEARYRRDGQPGAAAPRRNSLLQGKGPDQVGVAPTAHAVIAERSEEAIQLHPLCRTMDCFAEPVIGRAFARPVGCVPSMNDSLEVEVLCPA